jgi:heme a synthase
MTRRFTRLGWTAAAFTYLLIVLGAIVRISGSGLGCGEQWPLCRGRLLPPLDLPTLIEYGHRLTAAAVSLLVLALALTAWWLRRVGPPSEREGVNGPIALSAELVSERPSAAAYLALGLLVLQVALGAVTVRLRLPPWTVILHLGTAMLLLATLIVAARGPRRVAAAGRELAILGLGFTTVVFGALTANLGAASACLGFPLCNGRLLPDGNYLQHLQWTHRVLAYALVALVLWWAVRAKRRGPWGVAALLALQVVVAAAMVLLARPPALQAAHAAVGTAAWAALVRAAL